MMTEHQAASSGLAGYGDKALNLLQSSGIAVGDHIRMEAGPTYEGILMPRYEGGMGDRIVIKLGSGYNVSIGADEITHMTKMQGAEVLVKSPPIARRVAGLPRVLLLSTGGTISSSIDYRTGAVRPAMTPEELNAGVPELSDIAEIETRVIFSEYSENIRPLHWMKVARVLDGMAGSRYDGIIIAHGTDTIQYTASYLSFALAGFPIPIALVGSQRSSDRPSSDAATNLIAACRFVTRSRKEGVYVVMHHNESDDEIACHMATRVRKSHTSKRGAFKTIGGDPAFLVSGEHIHNNMQKSFFSGSAYEPGIVLEEKVGLIKYHPGYDYKLLDHMIDSGYKGVIFEGTGLGHIGDAMYESVDRAYKKGIFMGMTSQCIDGRVRMTVYESGRDLLNLGIIPLENILPETALVKAMWVLGRHSNYNTIRRIMLDEIASEFGGLQ